MGVVDRICFSFVAQLCPTLSKLRAAGMIWILWFIIKLTYARSSVRDCRPSK